MKIIDGHNVKIFTDNIETGAIEQINQLLSIDVFCNCKIRIMPDVHAGAGCVIGFTGDLGDKVIPNIVGVDIGCGILVRPFRFVGDINFHALNEFIVANIPSGRNVREGKTLLPQPYIERYQAAKQLAMQLRCYRELKDQKRLYKAIGTLGGGNHYIEIDRDDRGRGYIAVHTGSRNLGKQVAEIYQRLAVKLQSGWGEIMAEQNAMIKAYKEVGRKAELQDAIRQLHNSFKMRKPPIDPDLCYLWGDAREDYLYDMRLCQQWARINRSIIVDLISEFLLRQGSIEIPAGDTEYAQFESVHNYIGDDNIIRKGAISARAGERCIIPLNMRDGALICVGRGNEDWNYSAPHGAGRILSRGEAFRQINMDDFKHSMEGIYSETVTEDTLDESPMVYKPKDEIIANIKDTVEIINIVKPVFNFKAAM